MLHGNFGLWQIPPLMPGFLRLSCVPASSEDSFVSDTLYLFLLFRAALAACGSSQARG